MYVFTNSDEHSEGGHYPGKVIMGSSNLSFQSPQGRTEVNATFRDESDYNEAAGIFSKLWNNAAILILEKQHLKTIKYRRNMYEIVDNT
jgi:hypothetical protein